MNIFVLDESPVISAQSLCNKHVGKMLIESAQLLCTALILCGTKREFVPYKPTHSKHPCTIWTADSAHNMRWLHRHATALGQEFTKRYHKQHKTAQVIDRLLEILPSGNLEKHTRFAQAMPDEWKHDDAVTAYRCYYVAAKSEFAKWSPLCQAPDWWPFDD